MFELCAFSSNSSSLSHNLHRETFGWGLTFTLKRYLDSLLLNFSLSDLWQNFDRLHSFRCVTDFSLKRSTNPPLWHFPNTPEPLEAYYWHHVLRHGQEESCPRTFLGRKSVRQKADFYLLPCWILGGLTLSAPSCGADLPQPPYTQRISVVLILAFYEKLYHFHCEFSIAPFF